jgi:hypothetical protein
MSSTLKKKYDLLEKLEEGKEKELKLVESSSKLSSFPLPEVPQDTKVVRNIKSVDLAKNENNRLRREKDLLLDQLSKLNLEVESKKDELEYTKALMQDKVSDKQILITDLKGQEQKYKGSIQRLSEQVSQLKVDLEDNERRFKESRVEASSIENRFKSTLLDMQNNIEESEEVSGALAEKIDHQEKHLTKIQVSIEEKEVTLAKNQSDLKALQNLFNSIKLRYDSLTKEHERVSKVILELETYEKDLVSQRELAQEKLNNEIERNKLRYDIERKTQFENLNSKLNLREQDWEKEHNRRTQKRESQFERLMSEKEFELNKKVQQAEKEVFEIHAKARRESVEIRESSEKLLKEAYSERQRLLDEGSKEKMKAMSFVEEQVQASQLAAEKIRSEANEKLRAAEDYFKESEVNSKKLLDSARSKGEGILRKADIRKRTLLRNAQIENEQITKRLRDEEKEFLGTLEQRKVRLNNYLQIKRNRVLKNIEENNEKLKEKEEQLRLRLLDENQKIKRKELKKVVLLKDQVIKKVNESFEVEREKIRKFRKKELHNLYQERKEVLLEIAELKNESAKKHKNSEKEHRRHLAQKEKIEEKLIAERKESLELEYSKNMANKIKQLEDSQKDNLARLKSQVGDYVNSLVEENKLEMSSFKLKNEINSIFQNTTAHKKDKLLKNTGQKSIELKSKDINTFVTKYVYKALIPMFMVLFFVFNGLGSRDIVVSLGETFYQVVKDNSKSNEAKNLQEELDKKTFSPVLTAGFKETYVDNILYTKDFLSTYESDKFQNDWLLGAYSFISDELELSEEVAIQFISAEGAFIKELSELRSKIDARFSKDSILKMRGIEEAAFKVQIEQFKTIENWKAFKAYRNNFFMERF